MWDIEISLPYPPSLNRYYRATSRGVLISASGRAYKREVALLLLAAGIRPLDGPIEVELDLYPPDRKRRDCDNTLKGLLDACVPAAYHDDSQIDRLIITRCAVVKGGRVVLRIRSREKPS